MTDDEPEPTETDVIELAELIEREPWTVTEWSYSAGLHDQFSVTIDLVWTGVTEQERRERAVVKEAIRYLTNADDETPLYSRTVTVCERFGLSSETVEARIHDLRSVGEVYEPQRNHLRVV